METAPDFDALRAERNKKVAEAQQSAPSSSQRRGRGQSGLGIE